MTGHMFQLSAQTVGDDHLNDRSHVPTHCKVRRFCSLNIMHTGHTFQLSVHKHTGRMFQLYDLVLVTQPHAEMVRNNEK